jgi:capsular polysaccharide biosynthesis protein
LLITIVAASLGYAAASRARPVYQASVSILVGQPFQTPNLTKDNLEVGQQVALTYADVIQRQPVLGPVARNMHLAMSWNQLSHQVKAVPAAQDPQLIVVTVNNASRQTAIAIAGEIAKQAIALSPDASQTAGDTQAFVSSRLSALQASITAQQVRLNQLHRSLKAIHAQPARGAKQAKAIKQARAVKRERAAIQRQINNEQRLLISSQQSYASLGAFLTTQQVPNSLQVLESAHASLSPVSSNVPFKTALAGAIGFFLGLGLAYILEFRAEASWKRSRQGAGYEQARQDGEIAYSGDLDDPASRGEGPPAVRNAGPRQGLG